MEEAISLAPLPAARTPLVKTAFFQLLWRPRKPHGVVGLTKGGIGMQALLRFLGTGLRRVHEDEAGLSTAELLGNAALAIGALVVIWGVLEAAGVEIVEWIRDQVTN